MKSLRYTAEAIKGSVQRKLRPMLLSWLLYIQRGYSLYRGTHLKDNKGFEANWMQCEAF